MLPIASARVGHATTTTSVGGKGYAKPSLAGIVPVKLFARLEQAESTQAVSILGTRTSSSSSVAK